MGHRHIWFDFESCVFSPMGSLELLVENDIPYCTQTVAL